jgi:hypothetical protein
MAAYWSKYFRENGPLTKLSKNNQIKGIDVVKKSLMSTINFLINNNKKVILIGPVPVYEKSVPMDLAIELATGKKFIHSSLTMQRQKNVEFFNVIESAKSNNRGKLFNFIDPIQWFCSEDCLFAKNGISMYRDANHLSMTGVLEFQDHLSHEMIAMGSFKIGVIK